jgi:DNA mismatch repair protein MutS
VEDPKKAKGVVKREVIEIISPGTTLNEKVLDQRQNNFLCALYHHRGKYGFAAVDVSTADFFAAEVREERIGGFIEAYRPKELLFSKSQETEVRDAFLHRNIAMFTAKDEWLFTYDFTEELVLNHFGVSSLKPFGLAHKPLATIAAGAVLYYLKENYLAELPHISRIVTVEDDEFMILDESTRRNLEINATLISGEREGTLIQVLDHTLTPMGARRLKQVVNQPLIDPRMINRRLDAVSSLLKGKLYESLREFFREIGDIERWISRLSTGRANGRDLKGVQRALETFPGIIELLKEVEDPLLKELSRELEGLDSISGTIEAAIVENPPLTITEGGVIRSGFNRELDELKEIAAHGKEWLVKYAAKEKERTGISSLKIGYNRVFGYYIDVTKVHQEKVPPEYIRKQTLVNSERYITEELKKYEDKILGAEDKIKELEYKLFQQVREKILEHTGALQDASVSISLLDVLSSFSLQAEKNKYVKPLVHSGDELYILNGRHPVVEHTLPPGEDFIPNDIDMNCGENQIIIITGPNMAGKSTYLRMAGLIVLLAQIGSFVPAEESRIGVVDRIFTRVGASDSLTTGESTFMVEMNETAYILNHATPRSLILLDEIGRGTSTFDGLSIAWAVTEYLHQNSRTAAKTMFATHYHELIELEKLYPRIKNFNIAVKETGGKVIFMHKIVPGGTDNSYGIHVGQMAGLPPEVIKRAENVLRNLEEKQAFPRSGKRPRLSVAPINQIDLFSGASAAGKTSEVEEELKKIDVNNLTPIEALNILNELKKKL